MGISVQVTPQCGVYDENPLSYLVSVDGFNFLMDCGWNDHLDTSILEPLSMVASTVDAVLLSHSDTLHLGALPYAYKKLGLSAPIFATEPVFRLGLSTMYDHYLSRKQQQSAGFELFTLDDIDSAFQNITRLTYSQNHHMTIEKGEGIVISPHVAGRLLGGTVWKITKDGVDVVYAVDFNHRKERHLNGTVLMETSFVRPSVLITDAGAAPAAYNQPALNNQPLPTRRKRKRDEDKEFLGDAIVNALRADGNVLLPVDTAGRVLELILILEQYWITNNLTYPIYFLTYVSSSTIDYVKTFLEWMGDSINAKSFEDNPFLLRHVKVLISKSELEKFQDGPKVVLASMASLEAGFAHDIFVEWASDAKNLVFFTERGQPGTLAHRLQSVSPKAVKVVMSSRVPLVGEELAAYEEEQNRKKKEESKTTVGHGHGHGDDLIDPMVIDTSTNNPPPPLTSAVGQRINGDVVLIDGFVLPSSGVAPLTVFPFYDKVYDEWDDFGQVINPDDYVIKDDDDMHHVDGDVNGKLDEGAASLIFDDTNTIPYKVVSTELTVQVKCSLKYRDIEGRSDGRSIQKILSHVAPLNLVLVHGSAEATECLKRHCLMENVCPRGVYAPRIGETIDVTSDLCADYYKVHLSEKLINSVVFKKLGEYEVAWIDAEVGKMDDTGNMLSLVPLSSFHFHRNGPPPPHKPMLIGDVKISDLSVNGVEATFGRGGGPLLCGDYVVALKKLKGSCTAANQQIILQGPLTEEYYKIREHVYSQF